MESDKERLRQRLRAAFQEEAGERVRVLGDALALVDQAPDQTTIESIYREIHSLKGAARAVSARAIEQLCQSWENLFAAIRKGQLAMQMEHIAVSRQAHGLLQQLLGDLDAAPTAAADMQRRLEQSIVGGVFAPLPITVPQQSELPPAGERSALAVPGDSLRVSAAILDTMLFQTEELQVVKLQARQNSHNLQEAASEFLHWRKLRHDVTLAARQLLRRQEELDPRTRRDQQTLLDYIDWTRDHLGQWEYRLGSLAKAAEQLGREIGAVSESLQRDMQALLLLPCSRLIEGAPAMAQEIAAELGKRVALHISGETLQVDKRILDELKSPLQHLLRNAVDHGIEPPAQRRGLGKPESGHIDISFRQESATRFELVVCDDGAGLDSARLKARAVSQQLIDTAAADAMSETDALQLALMSGLSTRDMITELSGRGLGLAIVKEKIERLGGHLTIGSEAGKGCRMVIRLPTSLSTYRALLVQVTDRLLAVPALAVERVLRLPWEQLKSVENRLTLALGEDLLPLARLAEILELNPDQQRTSALAQVILLQVGGNRFCLLVDEILGDQEVVVKPLGRQLQRVRNVLGVTQLGDGRIVPVLHPQDLFANACRMQPRAWRGERQQARAAKAKILVAEDSVTSRSLLRQILESAGYDVTTVNDGVEAWEALKGREFNLLVSDIEMPRMNGFALTEKIRANRNLGELPIVLVTALKSPEDRQRGLEAGASAYIAKSGFDQTNLLDVIRQLL